MNEPSDQPSTRPRVTARLDEPEETARTLFVAIGRVVLAAAGLEHALRLEVARLLWLRATTTDPGVTPDLGLPRLGKLSGGQLLKELQKLDLPDDLDKRIGDAIDRRNQLVHRTFEDPQLVKASSTGQGMEEVVQRIERLALDCAELAVELELVAIPAIEAIFGKSRAELIEIVKALDPSTLDDARDRQRFEALQAFGDLDRLAGAFDDLYPAGEPDL